MSSYLTFYTFLLIYLLGLIKTSTQICKQEEHPYVVSIRNTRTDSHRCGGSLLSRYWVLTSARCISPHYQSGMYTVVAGVGKINGTHTFQPGLSQKSLVAACYPHSIFHLKPILADIGLMRLAVPMNISKTVGFIQLASYLDLLDNSVEKICQPANVLSWHALETVGDIIEPSTVTHPSSSTEFNASTETTTEPATTTEEERNSTQKVPLKRSVLLECPTIKAITRAECERRYDRKLPKTIFCGYEKGKTSCNSDFGGPVVCGKKQFGIISYGVGCIHLRSPGIFTKVDKFHKFLKHTIMNGAPTIWYRKVLYLSSLIYFVLY